MATNFEKLSLNEKLQLTNNPYRKIRRLAAQAISAIDVLEILRALAMHRYPEARRAAASNPNTPKELLALLQKAGALSDLSSYTEARDELRPEEEEALLQGGVFARCLLARYPTLSEEIYQKLASDPATEVRATLALYQSRSTSIAIESEAYPVRRSAAKNQSTSLGVLHVLSKDKNPGVRAALLSNLSCPPDLFEAVLHQEKKAKVFQKAAQNPSISREWLLSLAEKFPKEIFQNAAFPLFQLEDPSLLSALGPGALLFLAGLEPLPRGFAQDALDDAERAYLFEVLASNPTTPSSVLARLLCNERPQIRVKASKNPNAPQDVIHLLYKAGADAELTLSQGAVDSLSKEEQEHLLELDGFACQLLAAHPSTSDAIKLSLADLSQSSIAVSLLRSTSRLSAEVLSRLSCYSNDEIRELVGARPELPLEEIVSWEGRGAPFWRSVAGRERLPALVIGFLVENKDPYIRVLAAKRLDLSGEQLRRLLLDRESTVRAWAAVHPKTPTDFIKQLWAAGASRDLKSFSPPQKEVSRELLLGLAQLGSFGEVLHAVNPRTPKEILEGYLAKRDRLDLLDALSQNPSLPEALALLLVNLNTDWICQGLLKNPSLSGQVIQQIAQAPQFYMEVALHRNAPSEVLRDIALSGDKRFSWALAKNPSTPAEGLEALATGCSTEEQILCLLVEHPNVPQTLLYRLAADASQRVRILAGRHPRLPEKIKALLRKAGSSHNLICYGSPDLTMTEPELRRARFLGPFGRALVLMHPNVTKELVEEELYSSSLKTLAPLWEQLGEEVIKARRSTASAELLKILALTGIKNS